MGAVAFGPPTAAHSRIQPHLLVHSAKGAWAPTSVQQQWDTITSASPVDIAGRLSSLENDVKLIQVSPEPWFIRIA
eukprot:492137-Pelagomonas_calceolata.AAC.2